MCVVVYTFIASNVPVEQVGNIFTNYIPNEYLPHHQTEQDSKSEKEPLDFDTVLYLHLSKNSQAGSKRNEQRCKCCLWERHNFGNS